MVESRASLRVIARRRLIGTAALGGLSLLALPVRAQTIELPLPGGPDPRDLTTAFPQKGQMIRQRTRPPLLETPTSIRRSRSRWRRSWRCRGRRRLNGFPMRLIVPGWYSIHWVKMLNDIEVLEAPDNNYWMKTAYRIPDTPHASVKLGESGFNTVPINRMVPRSFFTNVTETTTIKPGAALPVRGIAFGGDRGVSQVELSADGGQSWQPTALDPKDVDAIVSYLAAIKPAP